MKSNPLYSIAGIAVLQLYSISGEISKCDGKNGLRCCSGYKWNDEYGNCTKCPSGYYGLDCSRVCPFPNYGDNCIKRCGCEAQICHFARGCVLHTDSYTKTLKETSPYRTSVKQSRDYGKLNSMLTTKTIPSVFGDFDKKENSTHLIEANIKVIFSTTFASRGFEKYKNRNENNNNFQFPIQIGIASILLFFLLLVFAHFIKKLVRRQKTKGIQTLKPKDFSSESDHYHSLGNIEQSYPLHHDNDVVFDGVAEVKIKYDTETKTFKVGFQTKQSNQEGRNRGAAFDIMKSADTIKLKECCSLPVANVNMNMAYMSPESIEEQLPLIPHPQNESKRKDEDFGNPYLIAVKDD